MYDIYMKTRFCVFFPSESETTSDWKSPKWKWLYVSARLAVPYHFSISLTCGFAFRYSAGTCFHVMHTRHLALKGLKKHFEKLKLTKNLRRLPSKRRCMISIF